MTGKINVIKEIILFELKVYLVGGGMKLTYSITGLCIVSTRQYDSIYVQLKINTQNLDDILY